MTRIVPSTVRGPALADARHDPLGGVHSVLATPFLDDDAIDLSSLDRLVDRQIAAGVAGIVLFGLAGEGRRLTAEERIAITRRVSTHVRGRLSLVAAADHDSAVGTAKLASAIEDAGASAVMVLPPTGIADDDGLVDYYRRIDEATSLPIIVQDAPAATGVVLSVNVLARIASETERARWVKIEAPPTAPKIADVIGATEGSMRVLGGMGGRNLIAELRAGASGTMIGCAFPSAFVAIQQAWARGDGDRAEALWEALLPLVTFDDSIDMFIACQKILLVRDGTFRTGRLRAPAVQLDPRLQSEWLRRVARMAERHPELVSVSPPGHFAGGVEVNRPT